MSNTPSRQNQSVFRSKLTLPSLSPTFSTVASVIDGSGLDARTRRGDETRWWRFLRVERLRARGGSCLFKHEHVDEHQHQVDQAEQDDAREHMFGDDSFGNAVRSAQQTVDDPGLSADLRGDPASLIG